jgi:hypothetical protein
MKDAHAQKDLEAALTVTLPCQLGTRCVGTSIFPGEQTGQGGKDRRNRETLKTKNLGDLRRCCYDVLCYFSLLTFKVVRQEKGVSMLPAILHRVESFRKLPSKSHWQFSGSLSLLSHAVSARSKDSLKVLFASFPVLTHFSARSEAILVLP